MSELGSGSGAVLLAAAIGLIPGCGPQIIAITAYVEGLVSFPALVANAISQDGDAFSLSLQGIKPPQFGQQFIPLFQQLLWVWYSYG